MKVKRERSGRLPRRIYDRITDPAQIVGAERIHKDKKIKSDRGAKTATAPRDDKRKDDAIRAWLDGIGFGDYAIIFQNHGVDEKLLPSLTRKDLKEMGITAAGPIRRILNAIRDLGKEKAVPPESDDEKMKKWLKSMGLGEYAGMFKIHKVNMKTLRSLTSADLKEMGVTLVGDLRTMCLAIRDLP